jgi:hypothetical protein
MTDISELPPEERRRFTERVRHGLETARLEMNFHGERALKYVFTVNGGSAVALLAFMGASEQVRREGEAWVGLALFLAGLLVLGACYAVEYHSFSINYQHLDERADKLLDERISIEEYSAPRVHQDTGQNVAMLLGYVSWFCWIVGVVALIFGFSDMLRKLDLIAL